MKEAMGHFMKLTQSERERLWEEQRQKSEWIWQGRLEHARSQGLTEGVHKGRKEGLTEGVRQGHEKGVQEGQLKVALQMLKEKADINFISRVTGLTKEKVLKLQGTRPPGKA